MLITTLRSIYDCKPPIHTVTVKKKKDAYICLRYLGNYSFILRKKLMLLARRFYPKIQLRCIFMNDFSIGSLFKFKDRLSPLLRTSVVYQYSCGQRSSSYIGQTVKQLKVRISQHKGSSFRTNSLLSCPENSKILEHNSEHPINDNGLHESIWTLECAGRYFYSYLEFYF